MKTSIAVLAALLIPLALPAQDRTALIAERQALALVRTQEAALVAERDRRIRVIDSLLAIPAPAPAPAPVPAAPLLFLADAETGDAKQWCHVHSAVPVGVVTSPVRDGRYAFKAEVRDGALIYSSERSEYANGPTLCGKHTYKAGDENWTAISIYPAADFPKYTHWSLVAQFKGPHTGTPPLQISLRNDEWGIYGSGRVNPRPYWKVGVMQRGAWNDFVLHVKWSPDPAVGWFEVYYQGQLVIPKTSTATMYLDSGVATPLFLSVGHYRDSGPTTGTAILYVDAVKVGLSLADVTPKP